MEIVLDFIVLFGVCGASRIQIDMGRVHRVVPDHFIGVNLDASIIQTHWADFLHASKSVKLRTLSSALSPCYMRVGGTAADFLIFQDGSSSGLHHTRDTDVSSKTTTPTAYMNFNMTGSMFDHLYDFVSGVGWNLTFDLNMLVRRDGWDPANAVKLMNHVAKKGYQIAGWELGDEPNIIDRLVHLYLPPEQLARDYGTLKTTLLSYTQFKDSIIIGPSVTQFNDNNSIAFFKRFLSTSPDVVTAASFHHYYLNTKSAAPEDYVDPAVLNTLLVEVQTGVNVTMESGSRAKLWLGETGTAAGVNYTTAPTTYRGVFMLLDKFGVCASEGVDAVIWHSFYGGMNSLVDVHSLEPNPIYWVTLMYKLLVGNKVLKMETPGNRGRLRAYTHCTATQKSGYAAGSMVVYIMNLYATDRNVTFPDLSPAEPLHLFKLESPQGDLDSKTILLNGDPLKMINDSTLPDLLQPIRTTAVPLTVKPFTVVFAVFPNVRISACLSDTYGQRQTG